METESDNTVKLLKPEIPCNWRNALMISSHILRTINFFMDNWTSIGESKVRQKYIWKLDIS